MTLKDYLTIGAGVGTAISVYLTYPHYRAVFRSEKTPIEKWDCIRDIIGRTIIAIATSMIVWPVDVLMILS